MSEEPKLQESIKKTQDLLGKYISKPPLTEKLLKKPPFRFLHDIVNAIIKETGFLKGLFTEEELNSSSITDKEGKLAYLTKLIDVIKLITGNELSVRPSKIVSGQEPIKTNELLQAIGKALDKKIPSSEAIDHYKKSVQRREKQRVKKSVEKKEKKSTPNDEKPRKIQLPENKPRKFQSADSNDHKAQSYDENIRKASKKLTSSESVKPNDRINEKNEKTKKKIHRESVERKKVRVKIIESAKKEKDSFPSAQEVVKCLEEPTNEGPLLMESSTEQNVKSSISQKEVRDEVQQMEITVDDESNNEENAKLPEMTAEITLVDGKFLENTLETKKISLLRPPSVRPPSARPGAPKIRAKTDFIVNPDAVTQMGDVNIIVENFDTKDDDIEDMVIVDSSGTRENLIGSTDLLNKELIKEHGYLVAQILETQRELVNEGNVEIIPNKVEIEWEAGMKKDKAEAVVREVDKLRETIQRLTRTTNPLGKLMDFLQEDVEIMDKELWDWKNQFRHLREQLIVERNLMRDSMKPLEENLQEIEATIGEQMKQIFHTKANIMRNNQRIEKLLSGR